MSKNELFPYQETGAQWLATRKCALLADEMGLGKSAQSIRGSDYVAASKIIVLCPAVARVNWAREYEKFSILSPDFRVVLKGNQYSPHPTRSLITSYDLATSLHAKLVKERFDLLILDEVHFLKHPTTKRAQAVFGANGLVHRARRVWGLSGTPAENHAAELWPLFYLFGVTKLKYDAFITHYCHAMLTSFNRLQITGTRTEKIPELRSMLSKIMLRRKVDEVLKDLPAIHFGEVTVEAGLVASEDIAPEALLELRAEREMVEKALTVSTDEMKALEALAPSVSTLRRYTGLQKVQGVADLVRQEIELGLYEKVCLFAIHRGVIEGLKDLLKDLGVVVLNGSTPAAQKQGIIDAFQNDPSIHVFVGNIQSCGTAITLTAASQGIMVEREWVPGKNAQAVKRMHRIGQSKPVFIRFATLPDSLDQRIASIEARKTRELSAILDGA